ncbi:hypothetical protein LPJ74_001364 [Coemansia sp. RSA 1843]|nr:hypothetical protein LPJ74_001364 [Coemansia sp. RSA 1843]
MVETQAAGAFGLGRRALGLVLLLCVVFIWVASSFLVSNLFGEQEFNQPFFITYLNTGTFSLYLVGTLASHICRGCAKQQPPPPPPPATERLRTSDDMPRSSSSDTAPEALPLVRRSSTSGEEELRNVAHVYPDIAQDKLGTRETVRLGVQFCVLWFAANVTQNASLAYTTVASSSILCATSGLFTLLIGAAGGVEQLNATRLCAVAASIAGVYSIVKYGTNESHGASTMAHAWIGDLLALSSAALYGCYTTLLKRKIGDESRLDAPLFFGSVGVANIVLLWPGFPLLHKLGVERFQVPASPRIWGMVVVNALVGTFVSDYLWLQSMLMTSPLVVTLGLSLTIPLSMAGDIVLKGLGVSLPYCVGAVLVLSGFIAANL